MPALFLALMIWLIAQPACADGAPPNARALGLITAELTTDIRKRYNISDDTPTVTHRGVALTEVESGSAAATAGFTAPRLIVEVQGRTVLTPDDVDDGIARAWREGRRAVLLYTEPMPGSPTSSAPPPPPADRFLVDPTRRQPDSAGPLFRAIRFPTPPPQAAESKPADAGGWVLDHDQSAPKPPTELVHIVQSGETLVRIAARYNVSWTAIQEANGIVGTTIHVGQRLVIPGAAAITGSTAPPAETIPAPPLPAAKPPAPNLSPPSPPPLLAQKPQPPSAQQPAPKSNPLAATPSPPAQPAWNDYPGFTVWMRDYDLAGGGWLIRGGLLFAVLLTAMFVTSTIIARQGPQRDTHPIVTAALFVLATAGAYLATSIAYHVLVGGYRLIASLLAGIPALPGLPAIPGFDPNTLTVIAALLLLAAPVVWTSINKRLQQWRQRGATALAPRAQQPRPPTKTTLRVLTAAAFLVQLLIVWAIATRAAEAWHPLALDALMLGIAIVSISLPLARSTIDLAAKTAFFSLPLVALLAVIVYQSPLAFWIAAAVLAVITIRELGYQFSDAGLITQLVQAALLIAMFVLSLSLLAHNFLPTLATELRQQFDYPTLLRLRLVLSIYITTLVIVAILIELRRSYRFEYAHLQQVPPAFAAPAQPLLAALYPFAYVAQYIVFGIAHVGNIAANFLRLLGTLTRAFLAELLRFSLHAFLNSPLWIAAGAIYLTAICFIALVIDVRFMLKPPLKTVLTTPSILLDLADRPLLASNLSLLAGLLLAAVAVIVLFHLWLPRPSAPEARRLGAHRLALTAATLYLCGAIASVLYFPFLNAALALHSPDLLWPGNVPGFFTLLPVALAAFYRYTLAPAERAP